VRLFSPQANGVMGWVLSEPSDPVRRSLIALAPFLGGSSAIYFLVRFGLRAGEIDPLGFPPNDLGQGFASALSSVVQTLRSADLHHVATWLVLYVLFSLGFALAPSNDDLLPLATDAAVALGIVGFAWVIDVKYTLGLSQNALVNRVAQSLTAALQRLDALLLFSCAVVGSAAIIIVPSALFAYWLRLGFKQR
jgi:hypothetical protein